MKPQGECLRKSEWEVRTIDLTVAYDLVRAYHYAKTGSNTATFLRRFMGDGHGMVPIWKLPDGSINAERTVEAAFGLYNITPVEKSDGN